MEIGSLLLGAAILLLVGLFLARPFLLSNTRYRKQQTMRHEFSTQKEAVLAQIQVLEFDYETGTLPELDYKQQRKQLVAEAAELLRKLDELPEATAPVEGKTDNDIEAAIARLRQRPPRPAMSRPAQPLPSPTMPAKAEPKLQQQRPAPAAHKTPAETNGRVKFCSQCGHPVEEADNFCAYCGNKVHKPQLS